MRSAIYGSGGVGAYVGGRLQAGGHDVVFIARDRNLAALRTSGLRIKSVQGGLDLPVVAATDNPASVGRNIALPDDSGATSLHRRCALFQCHHDLPHRRWCNALSPTP